MPWMLALANRRRPLENAAEWISAKILGARQPVHNPLLSPVPALFTKIWSSLAGGIRSRFLRLQATFAPLTSARASFAGPFTRFRTPVNMATTRGQKTLGSTVARPTTGQACLWILNAELFMCLQVLLLLISTAQIASVTIFSQTACLP